MKKVVTGASTRGATAARHGSPDDARPLISTPPSAPVRAPGYLDCYSNSLRIGFTPMDLALTFGRTEDAPHGGAQVEDVVTVRMSPHQFKALTQAAGAVLERWERMFGEIPGNPSRPANLVRLDAAFEQVAKMLGVPQSGAKG